MASASSLGKLSGALALGAILGMMMGKHSPQLTAQSTSPITAESSNGNSNGSATTRPSSNETSLYEELDAQYNQFAQIDRTFALVSRAVAPSVVHIVARKSAGSPGRRQNEPSIVQETGSGVIVRPRGSLSLCVLSNHHVVQGTNSPEIAITLHDGRVLHPTRVWSDPKADIAVLELGRNDLPAARLGDSDQAIVGSWVLAMGSPFGLTHSISHGIISARNRHEPELEDEGVENQEFLQTDAAINPGNSGGPLVNMRGEVIGINTAIASSGGGSEGVGFSIPINLAKWIMNELVANEGRVNRGALGVRLQDVVAEQVEELGLDYPRGARILSVQDASPALAAGIRSGDVVLRFNGVDVKDINHLINLVSMSPIGKSVEVTLWREREVLSARVTVGSRDSLLTPDLLQSLPSVDEQESVSRRSPPPPVTPVPRGGSSR